MAKKQPKPASSPVQPEAPQYPEVNARCRRGSDPVTAGSSCSNMRAFRLSPNGSTTVTLKCTKCGFAWSTPVGGAVQEP